MLYSRSEVPDPTDSGLFGQVGPGKIVPDPTFLVKLVFYYIQIFLENP